MAYFKQVFMVVLPNGELNFIPLETILDCPIIVPDNKTTFVVHKKTTPGGASDGIGDHVLSPPFSQTDIDEVRAQNSICYVEVRATNHLSTPTNALGNRLIIFHTTIPAEIENQ